MILILNTLPLKNGIKNENDDENNDENNTNYGVNKDTGENNPDTIKYDTRVLKPNLCDYAEAYILVDGTIRAANALMLLD